jgi:hypothetical protein
MNANYGKHHSSELNELFSQKPYQGRSPAKAKFIFMGLDANFAPDIELMEFFSYIQEYLTDGVEFWTKHKTHHPFLLKDYKGDGVTYHKRFAKLNLDSSYADKLSFVELLDVPTFGKTDFDKFYQLLNLNHLSNLESIFLNPSQEKTIFISRGVFHQLERIKKIYKIFNWLPELPEVKANTLSMIFETVALRMYMMTHFSAAISDEHIGQIRKVITS